jgi:hypothetical protein
MTTADIVRDYFFKKFKGVAGLIYCDIGRPGMLIWTGSSRLKVNFKDDHATIEYHEPDRHKWGEWHRVVKRFFYDDPAFPDNLEQALHCSR